MNAVAIYPVSDMERMAKAFVMSKLFGVTNVDQALALCLIAQAEGRHPATAAQDYNIIQGRPAKKADAMLRDFLAGGGKVEWHTLTDALADATFSHPAGGSARIDWDMKRAQSAQLGGKDMWKKFPRQMLRSRVISEGVRTVYPMATSGMYEPGEVADFAPDPKPVSEPGAVVLTEWRDMTPRDEPAPNPAPLNSSQAKKSGKGELAAQLANEIDDLAFVTECLAWRKKHQAEVDTWPPKWRSHLWDKWQVHIDKLRELLGEENPDAETMFPETDNDGMAGDDLHLADDER